MKNKQYIKFISFTVTLCILFSSVFSTYLCSYNVRADDMQEDAQELAKNAVLMILSVVGAIVAPEAITPLFLATLGVEGMDIGLTIGNKIVDNGDGTATISADTIQMILDSSAYHVAEDGFSDSDVKNYDRSYNHNYYAYIKGLDGNGDSCLMSAKGSSNIFIAGKFDIDSDKLYTISGTIDFTNTRSVGIPASLYRSGNLYKNFTLGGGYGYGVYAPSEYCANFPIFKTTDELTNFLTTGEGYKDALNYNPDKVDKLRYGTNYSPTYSGTDVTVNINRLNNFESYYTKVINNNTDLDTDSILNILLEYILDTSEPEPETESDIEADTSDPGADLTDTNNWLQKIYNRIGEFMNMFNSQKNKLNGMLEKILEAVQDGFDDVVKQLKAIKRWTALDTVFDGLDAVADWLQFVTDFFQDVGSGVGALAEGFGDSIDLLVTKFPFSIPITLQLIMEMLAETPQAPRFEFNLKLDNYGVDEKLVIDLTDFQIISDVSRTLLTIIYIFGLYKLTEKIISIKKGD